MGLLLGQEFFLKDLLVFLFYLTLFAIFVFIEIGANILFTFISHFHSQTAINRTSS
jgi:hypothetical protein